MKDSKSSDVIQSPLNDQKKGKGFVLGNKNISDYQSLSKEKAASTSSGSNFFIFLGIVIFLTLVIQVPEMMAEQNSKRQMHLASSMPKLMNKAESPYSKNYLKKAQVDRDEIWKQQLAKNSFVLKKPVPNNDSQLLNQLNRNERLLAKIKKQNQDIKNATEEQKEILEYLEGRENNRQVRKRLKIFGNILLNLPL
jgi:hypothetical protein